ncbi:MAG TPA: peptide ABC transporter substrate-binding protein [Lacunisphaera sp.]|nr:peptide ABC transporter substrate-binding protein [Lacunisphaera sp.]
MSPSPRIHWWTSVVVLGVGAALALACFGRRENLAALARPPADRNVLRIAFTENLVPDPHRWSIPMPTYNHFILSLWEPLVGCDPMTGQPRPAAAESWSVSPDGLVVTFKLRPDGRWSNGDPVRAEDFVRAWQRLLRQPMEMAQPLYLLKNAEAFNTGRLRDPALVGARALDDLTLRIELEQVRTNVVAQLANPLLAPLHATTERVLATRAYVAQPQLLVSNGPFRLVAVGGDGYRFAVNDHFHGRKEVRLDGVAFVRAKNFRVERMLLAAGVVDLVSPLGAFSDQPWPTHRPVSMHSELVLAVSSLNFNLLRGPLNDMRVRQALAMALHRRETIDRFGRGRLVPAWSWVPGIPGREGLALMKEDAEQARRLLAEAGFPGGQGFPVLTMALSSQSKDDPFPPAWSENWYRELGIKTHLCYEPTERQDRRVKQGDYDIVYGTFTATVSDAADLLGVFVWPPEYSYSKWVDPEFARLLAKAEATSGAARLAILEQAERRAMAAMPAVPVTFTRRAALMADEVRGWYEDPLGRQSPKRLWLAANPVPDEPVRVQPDL